MNYSAKMTLMDKLKDRLRYTYYSLMNERHQFNMERFKSCNNTKPKSIMAKELKELHRYWGCIPMQYYTHDFYRKDCKLTLEEMKEYIPGYYFYNVIYPQYDDLKRGNGILENKIVSHYIFKGLKLTTTNVFLLKKGKYLFNSHNALINQNTLEALLNDTSANKLFIKPVEGKGGKGIKIANKADGKFYIDGGVLSEKFLKSLTGDYLIEEKVNQVSYLDAVYSHSVNTLRAVTKRNKFGVVELIAVTLRMGVDGSELDNGSLGGLLIGIDVQTGKPLNPYAGYEFGMEKVYHHPNTQYKFSELEIGNWEETKDQILTFANRMVLHNLIGWDIALSDTGPLVIEANTQFGIDHSQSGTGGMRDFFREYFI